MNWKSTEEIADWQRRYYAQPKVWVTVCSDGVVSGVYDNREAAELEVEWEKKRGITPRIHSYPICSTEISRERWSGK